MFRRNLLIVLMLSTIVFVGCMSNKKVSNPIADVNSKQPDKVLYDRAMDAMKHNKFDVARLEPADADQHLSRLGICGARQAGHRRLVVRGRRIGGHGAGRERIQGLHHLLPQHDGGELKRR